MKHGGDLTAAMAAFGGSEDGWLDLSTGINPHAWPLPELAPRLWQSLPTQGDLDRFKAAARKAYSVPEEAGLVAAPGTQALIQWLPRLAEPGEIAIPGPTYAEHALAWGAAGFSVREVEALDGWPGSARHLVIVNPNNPDGRLIGLGQLAALAGEAQARSGWLVIDESFIDILPEASAASLCAHLPVLAMRSFGKFHGLAGVRLGALIAPPAIADRVEAALGPWAVSGPALAIGAAAFDDRAWADAMRGWLTGQAAALDGVLGKAGLDVIGGTALYRLARHEQAEALHQALAEAHIWVRRFEWERTLLRFGLPRDEAGLQRLALSLDAALAALRHSAPQGSASG